jgi:hypothetical protein
MYDRDERTLRLAHQAKLEAGCEVGEVWYVLDQGIIGCASIWSAPGVILKEACVLSLISSVAIAY